MKSRRPELCLLLALLAGFPDRLSATPRSQVWTFDSLTNSLQPLPIFKRPDNHGTVMLRLSGANQLPAAWNPANDTPALRLDAPASGSYLLNLHYGPTPPFGLKGFDVVSVTGRFTLVDTNSGARYEHDGSLGRVKLGRTFRKVKSVEIIVEGQVVLDNLEYQEWERAPVARVRLWNELRLPPIDEDGNTLLSSGSTRFVLAPDNEPFPLVLDASRSISPDGEALKFSWYYEHTYWRGDDELTVYLPLAGGVPSRSPYYRNRPAELASNRDYLIVVYVSDDYYVDAASIRLMVLRPQDVSRFIDGWFADNMVSGDYSLELLFKPSLRAATEAFAAGDNAEGRQALREFSRLIRIHLKPQDPMLARYFLALTDALLDVTSKGSRR